MPHVQGLHEKLSKNPNVAILALNVSDENEKMKNWWKDKKYTFPTLNDAEEIRQAYGIKVFPSSILIDPEGNVVKAMVGSAHELEATLLPLLEKSPTPAAPTGL